MPEMPRSATALLTHPVYDVIVRKVVLPWVLQGHEPAGEGLEIGAGGAAGTAQLLATRPALRMTVTDYDQHMVAAAVAALAPFGDRATVRRADAAHLDFADNRFDLVLSMAMLHHVGAWQRALTEAVRVLRPGGRLLGYDLLDTAALRLLHFGAGDTTLLRRGQLETALRGLPVTAVRVRHAGTGLAVRFSAIKTG